jgi:membrane fusion protein, multidrug efflux system
MASTALKKPGEAFVKDSRRIYSPLFLFILSFLIFLAGCNEKKEIRRPAVPVTAAMTVQKTVPVQITAFGNVKAITCVSVKAQVGGVLTRTYFKEGDFVTKGARLFTIDPKPYEAALRESKANCDKNLAMVTQARANHQKNLAQLNEAKANLEREKTLVNQAIANMAKDQAEEKNARDQLRRYRYLIEKGFATQEQYDRIKANADGLQATLRASQETIEHAKASVRSQQALVEEARASIGSSQAAVETALATLEQSRATADRTAIDLGYCEITSPMDGRTGSLLVQEGNVIKANDTISLVVINKISPIYVEFSVPEKHFAEIKKHMSLGKLKVEAEEQGLKSHKEEGIVTFMDNTVDTTTGTLTLRATFPNRSQALWPGQFVNVTMTLSLRRNAIVIPTEALQTGQKGDYVYVVKSDMTAEYRPVTISLVQSRETIIQEGLTAGEMVVTDGHLRLVNGCKVEVKSAKRAQSSESTSS